MALPTLEPQTSNPQNCETLHYSSPGKPVQTPSYLLSPCPSGFFTGGNGYVAQCVCDLTFARCNNGQEASREGEKGERRKMKGYLVKKTEVWDQGWYFTQMLGNSLTAEGFLGKQPLPWAPGVLHCQAHCLCSQVALSLPGGPPGVPLPQDPANEGLTPGHAGGVWILPQGSLCHSPF